MKRSETVGNGRKHDQAKTCPTRIFFKMSVSAQRSLFFEGPKVSKGKQLETVGDRTFARQKDRFMGMRPTLQHPMGFAQAQATRCYRRKRWPCGRRGTSRAVLRLKPLEDVEKPWFPWEKKSTKVDFPHLS